jgi:hypothetical protein
MRDHLFAEEPYFGKEVAMVFTNLDRPGNVEDSSDDVNGSSGIRPGKTAHSCPNGRAGRCIGVHGPQSAARQIRCIGGDVGQGEAAAGTARLSGETPPRGAEPARHPLHLAHQHALDILSLPELGLRIPADVSVVGFDDLPFADWVTPRLTTVRTPLADMTALAARMVLRLLSGEQPETTRVEVATEMADAVMFRTPSGDAVRCGLPGT